MEGYFMSKFKKPIWVSTFLGYYLMVYYSWGLLYPRFESFSPLVQYCKHNNINMMSTRPWNMVDAMPLIQALGEKGFSPTD